jgi:stage V sporulation protein B
VLLVATLLVKIIGAIYKIPLSNMIGTVGRGYYDAAYNIYLPIYTISMAGLPVAVSKMVSEQMALGHYRDARMIFKVSSKIFLITGTLGLIILLLLAYPYAALSKNLPTIPAIVAIAPSIFFCCLMSIFRGYYEGLRKMTPTAVSEVFEALGKLIFGIVLAKIVITKGMADYNAGLSVFGKTVSNESEALSAIFPYAAAAAALGVTLGTVLGLLYLVILYKIKGDEITREELVNSPEPEKSKTIAKNLIKFAIPVATSSLIFSITNMIDSVMVQNRLQTAIDKNMPLIKSLYGASIAKGNVLDGDIKTFLFGAYSLSLDFKNLVPNLAMALGISAIPALSAAWAIKNKDEIRISVESVIRVILLISFPAGIGMAVLSEPILSLLYSRGESAAAIPITTPILAAYGFTVFIMALSTPMTNMLQAIGKPMVPLKALTVGAVAKIIINYVLVGIPSVNINGAVVGTVVCYVIILGISLYSLIKTTGVKINIMSVAIKPLICAALCGAGAFISYKLLGRFITFGSPDSILNSKTLSTFIAIGIAALIYLISLLLVKGIAKDDIIMLPKGEKIAKTLEKYGFLG